MFYEPYVSKYFDGAGFEKSLQYAMKKCVQNEDWKVIFYVSSAVDHVYADLINMYISNENERLILRTPQLIQKLA